MSDEVKVEVPAKFQAVVDQVEKYTALELSELVKILEAKFGVSAAAPMMMAAGGAAGACAAATCAGSGAGCCCSVDAVSSSSPP